MPTILIAEDNEGIREALGDNFEFYGFTVLKACNGHEALNIMKQDGAAVDLVITDYSMPWMTGPQLFKALRDLKLETPVILYCGQEPEVLEHCRAAGFAAVVSKVAGWRELTEKALAILGNCSN